MNDEDERWTDERRDDERRDVGRAQDDADRETKGKREAAENPADREDPRGDRDTPQPFSGPSR